MASVLDLRGARLLSGPEAGGASTTDVEGAEESGRSMGVVPSTAIETQEVKVVGGLLDISMGIEDAPGLAVLGRGERPLRAGVPRGVGLACMVVVVTEPEERTERRGLEAEGAVLQYSHHPSPFPVGALIAAELIFEAPIRRLP